jgi:hypothetical protein
VDQTRTLGNAEEDDWAQKKRACFPQISQYETLTGWFTAFQVFLCAFCILTCTT